MKKLQKLLVITASGAMTPAIAEFFAKRYSEMKFIVVSPNAEGEVNFSKLERQYGKAEIVTFWGVLSEELIEQFNKKGGVLTVWTLGEEGKPKYPFTYRK